LKIKITKKNGEKFNITDTRTMTKPRCWSSRSRKVELRECCNKTVKPAILHFLNVLVSQNLLRRLSQLQSSCWMKRPFR